MRFVPRSMAAKVIVALSVAAAAVVALDRAVRNADVRERSNQRPSVAVPAPLPPVRLAPVSGTILLARSLRAVPATAAPVVEVFEDGGYAVRRPSPVPSGPQMAPAAPAIVVPSAEFGLLGSRARATLCEVVGSLVAERPVGVDRFLTAGLAIGNADLERVLRWVR